MNKLFYGDNLDVLRNHVADESVDFIYLDPPFNSNANYNVLFKSKIREGADAQITFFEDSWHWNDKAEDARPGDALRPRPLRSDCVALSQAVAGRQARGRGRQKSRELL